MPLFVAAQKNRTEIAKTLLTAGADPNIEAANGATALIQAAAKGNTDLVKALLTHSAATDPEVKGWTALKIAKSRKHNEIITVLEKAK